MNIGNDRTYEGNHVLNPQGNQEINTMQNVDNGSIKRAAAASRKCEIFHDVLSQMVGCD